MGLCTVTVVVSKNVHLLQHEAQVNHTYLWLTIICSFVNQQFCVTQVELCLASQKIIPSLVIFNHEHHLNSGHQSVISQNILFFVIPPDSGLGQCVMVHVIINFILVNTTLGTWIGSGQPVNIKLVHITLALKWTYLLSSYVLFKQWQEDDRWSAAYHFPEPFFCCNGTASHHNSFLIYRGTKLLSATPDSFLMLLGLSEKTSQVIQSMELLTENNGTFTEEWFFMSDPCLPFKVSVHDQ